MRMPRRTKFKKLIRRAFSGWNWCFLLAGGIIVLMAANAIDHFKQPTQPLRPAVSGSITIPWVPETVKRWDGTVAEMAKKYEIDPNLLAIIMTIESGGNPTAKSPVGAEGLMQIMPMTAKDIAAKFVKKPISSYDLQDPRTNIEFGAAYLAYLRREFGDASQGPTWNDTVELVAAGYNGGPGAAASLAKGEGLQDMQTVSYSRDARDMWRERKSSASPAFTRWVNRGGQALIDTAVAEK